MLCFRREQYCGGVACLVVSEVCYGAWMAASLASWWRTAPQAELARRGLDLLHDLKPALLAVEHYHDVAHALYEMIEVRIPPFRGPPGGPPPRFR